MIVCAVSTLIPSMRVKFTPAILVNSPARLNSGEFPPAFFPWRGGGNGSPGSRGPDGNVPKCFSISWSHSLRPPVARQTGDDFLVAGVNTPILRIFCPVSPIMSAITLANCR